MGTECIFHWQALIDTIFNMNLPPFIIVPFSLFCFFFVNIPHILSALVYYVQLCFLEQDSCVYFVYRYWFITSRQEGNESGFKNENWSLHVFVWLSVFYYWWECFLEKFVVTKMSIDSQLLLKKPLAWWNICTTQL